MLRCSKKKRGALAAGVLVMLPWSCVRGQTMQVKAASALHKSSPEEFHAHMVRLQAVEQACNTQSVCDAKAVGEDERVEGPQTFQMRWQWLRDTLDQAKSAKAEQRGQLMQEASARLDEMMRESAQPGAGSQAQFSHARTEANRILAGAEFSAVEQQSWLDRAVARFWFWVQRAFGGAAALGSIAPWLGRLLEWLLFGSAAVGLVFFVQRNLQRQRLAVALNSRAGELAWSRESQDWAAQAEGSARDGDWRDAVHCLYWATIVMLEGRRAWRHNPARTPREYVRLLKPGSAQRNALRGLTQIFERLWYGLRDASAADYERARSLYESLRNNASADASSTGAI